MKLASVSMVLFAASCGAGPRGMYTAAPYAPPVPPSAIAVDKTTSGEDYDDYGQNPWIDASKDHLSTFAADVDTASYTIARRKLHDGELPPAASVRVEEWVNYFHYAFPRASRTRRSRS